MNIEKQARREFSFLECTLLSLYEINLIIVCVLFTQSMKICYNTSKKIGDMSYV